MEAEIVTVRGTDVVIKRGTRQFTVAMTRFCKADQDYMIEWKKNQSDNLIPKLKIEISSRKSDRSDRQDFYDDRKGSFQMSAKISNEELSYSLEGCTASLSVIGVDCENSSKYGIMQKSSFNINLKPGKTASWLGVPLHYKFDDHAPAVWGAKYYGYVLQIKNAKGKVIYNNSTPKKFEKHISHILQLELHQGFDKSMGKRDRIHVHTL